MMKERSHVSSLEAPHTKWMLYTTMIGMLEMSEVGKSDPVPAAVG